MQSKIIIFNEKEKEQTSQRQLFNHLYRRLRSGEGTKLIWNLRAGWRKPTVLGYPQDIFYKQSANVFVRKTAKGLRLNWCDTEWNVLTYSEIHKKNAFWYLFISAKRANKIVAEERAHVERNTTKKRQKELFTELYSKMLPGEEKESPTLVFKSNQPYVLGHRFNYLVNIFDNKELIKICLVRTKTGFLIRWLNEKNEEKARDKVLFNGRTWQVLKHKTNDLKQEALFTAYYQKMQLGGQNRIPELKFKTLRPELLKIRKNLRKKFTRPEDINVIVEKIEQGLIIKWSNEQGIEKARDEIHYNEQKKTWAAQRRHTISGQKE
jgi:(2Fe-2S) ferredoxin